MNILLVNDVAAEVAQRSLEHVEDKLRPRGAASRASAQFRAEMLLVLGLGEILEHLVRRAEEDELAALVQQERLAEHLENLRSRLVDRHQHDLVVRHRRG